MIATKNYIEQNARFEAMDGYFIDVWIEKNDDGTENYLVVDSDAFDFDGSFGGCEVKMLSDTEYLLSDHFGVCCEYLMEKCTLSPINDAKKVLKAYLERYNNTFTADYYNAVYAYLSEELNLTEPEEADEEV